MNRKQRRAAIKQSPTTHGARASASVPSVAQLFTDALRFQQQNRLDEAAHTYKRLLLLNPDHAEASNNLGCVLMAQHKLAEASACFARALELTPQLFDQFAPICAILVSVLPPIDAAMRKAVASWPMRLPVDRLIEKDSDRNLIVADPLLRCVLQSTSVREVALERLLTSLRMSLLNDAVTGAPISRAMLVFYCALA